MACLSLPPPAKAKALTILFLFTYLPTPLASFSHLRIWDESISSKPPPSSHQVPKQSMFLAAMYFLSHDSTTLCRR
jgi:hypothetical protein